MIQLLILISQLSFSAPAMKSAGALTTKIENNIFVGELKTGFHFNDKAPNEVNLAGRAVNPSKISTTKIEFPLGTGWASGKAMLYICDDAVTVCEIQEVAIAGKGKAPSSKVQKKNVDPLKGQVNSEGFIQNDLEKALKIAKAKKQLVLIDFSARWCPGCIRYEKEVFPTKEFKAIAKNFVKVKIDVDYFESVPISERYKIIGIPTFVFVNAEEQEIDRLVDFLPAAKLKPWFKAVANDPMPLQQAMAKVKLSDKEALFKLGKRLLAVEQYDKALEYLSLAQPKSHLILTARVNLLQKKYKDKAISKSEFTKELAEIIEAEPNSMRSIGWRSELVDALDPKSSDGKAVIKEASQLKEKLLVDEKLLVESTKTEDIGEFLGFEKMLFFAYWSEFAENAKFDALETEKMWEEAVRAAQSYKLSAKLAGPALRKLIFLSSAKRWQQAESWANELLKADPENYDVHRRKMRILLGQNKHAEAIAVGEKIIEHSVGRNQVWVAESLAKAYLAADKKLEAKKLLQAYLAKPEINVKNVASVKKSMEDLLKGIK